MQLRLTCVLKAQCTRAFQRCSLNNTPTPCRNVSQRVIRGDRRRCGVSESSVNLALAADTFVDVMRPECVPTACTMMRADICLRWNIPRCCISRACERERALQATVYGTRNLDR